MSWYLRGTTSRGDNNQLRDKKYYKDKIAAGETTVVKKDGSKEQFTQILEKLKDLETTRANSARGGDKSQLNKHDDRYILAELHANKQFSSILDQLGIKKVSQYFIYDNELASLKLSALREFLEPEAKSKAVEVENNIELDEKSDKSDKSTADTEAREDFDSDINFSKSEEAVSDSTLSDVEGPNLTKLANTVSSKPEEAVSDSTLSDVELHDLIKLANTVRIEKSTYSSRVSVLITKKVSAFRNLTQKAQAILQQIEDFLVENKTIPRLGIAYSTSVANVKHMEKSGLFRLANFKNVTGGYSNDLLEAMSLCLNEIPKNNGSKGNNYPLVREKVHILPFGTKGTFEELIAKEISNGLKMVYSCVNLGSEKEVELKKLKQEELKLKELKVNRGLNIEQKSRLKELGPMINQKENGHCLLWQEGGEFTLGDFNPYVTKQIQKPFAEIIALT